MRIGENERLAEGLDAAARLESLEVPSICIPTDSATPMELLARQGADLGVSLPQIPDAELEKGRCVDARVTEAQQNAISAKYSAAQISFLKDVAARVDSGGRRVLFGPTSRVVDHVLKGDALAVLAARLAAEGKRDELLRAIDKGPCSGDVAFEPAATPVELIANIVRWSVLRGVDKKRFRVSDDIRSWIGETLEHASYDSVSRLGGVSAVGSALAEVLGHTPTMVSLGAIPAQILQFMPPGLSVIGSDRQAKTLADIPVDEAQAGNFCIASRGDPVELFPGESLLVNGEAVSNDALGTFDILVTGAGSVPGFADIDTARLKAIGAEHSVMVLTGTRDLSTDKSLSEMLEALNALHSEGMPIALLYAETKAPAIEVKLWKSLREQGLVEFFGMNTSEAYDICSRILSDYNGENTLDLSGEQAEKFAAALACAAEDVPPWKNGRENPRWLFLCAEVLQAVLDIPAVRVRGRSCDVLLVEKTSAEFSEQGVVNHLIVSRDLGTLKTANSTGLLDCDGELGILRNIPSGEHLAALHVVADECAAFNRRYCASPAPCVDIALSCKTVLADGRRCFAVPPVEMYDKKGGTQSAGDTMDVTFVMEEAENLLKALYRRSPS